MPSLYPETTPTDPVDTLYCFPDTNVFLHFPTFDEVDWPSTLRAKQIYLVLAPIVLRELNTFKDDNTNLRRRHRTRKVVSKLTTLLDSTDDSAPIPVRSRVFLIGLPDEPKIDWASVNLDPTIGDDRFIASILEFAAAYPDRHLLLISNDSLARQKAKGRKIPRLDPETLMKKIDLATPETDQIRDLQKQVQMYESRMPKLTLAFWDGETSGGKVKHEFQDKGVVWHSDDVLKKVVDERKERLRMIIDAAPTNVSEIVIKQFHTQYRNYIRSFKESWIKQRARAAGQRFLFAFVLTNVGSAPATDIEIELDFPAEAFVVGLADEDTFWGFEDLDMPSEPEPDWKRAFRFMGSVPYIPSPAVESARRDPRPRGPLYSPNHRNMVTYAHPKLRATESWRMKPLAAFIPPRYSKGFQIDCSMHADELVAPIAETLVVTLERAPSS